MTIKKTKAKKEENQTFEQRLILVEAALHTMNFVNQVQSEILKIIAEKIMKLEAKVFPKAKKAKAKK